MTAVMEWGLAQFLLADAGVAALVGDRIEPGMFSPGLALPAIKYLDWSTTRQQTHDGPSGAAVGRVQLDCWAADYKTAKLVARAVRLALDGYQGIFGSGADAVPVGYVRIGADRFLPDPDPKLAHVQLDAEVGYAEEVAA